MDSTTIDGLKQSINVQTPVPVNQMQLLHNKRELKHGRRTLREYGITGDAEVTLIIKARGAGEGDDKGVGGDVTEMNTLNSLAEGTQGESPGSCPAGHRRGQGRSAVRWPGWRSPRRDGGGGRG